jgi:hypothetical protein
MLDTVVHIRETAAVDTSKIVLCSPCLPAPLHACLLCRCAATRQMLAHSTSKFKIAFNCYDQSSKATSSSDSSVSYAAAIMTPL